MADPIFSAILFPDLVRTQVKLSPVKYTLLPCKIIDYIPATLTMDRCSAESKSNILYNEFYTIV